MRGGRWKRNFGAEGTRGPRRKRGTNERKWHKQKNPSVGYRANAQGGGREKRGVNGRER